MKDRYTDEEVLDGLRNNSNHVIKYLLTHSTGHLRKFVLRNGGDNQDSEDIVHRSILILYEKAVGSFDLQEGTKLSTYLYGIGKNQWLKELRQRKKMRNLRQFQEITNDGVQIEEFEFGPEDKGEKLLIEALDRLDEDCVRLLRGKYYEQLSDKELSIEIGHISPENVRKRRYKCIQKLRKIFFTLSNKDG